MDAREGLRQTIDEQQRRLRKDIPSDREAAVVALLRDQDRVPNGASREPVPDLVSGHRLANLGGNKALQVCLEAGNEVTAPTEGPVLTGNELDSWADRFLRQCSDLAEAETVLEHCETGFMRLAMDSDGAFHAWIATKRTPTSWRERADYDWWAAWLAERHEPELRALRLERPTAATGGSATGTYDHRLAAVHLAMMSYQMGYPSDAAIGGGTVQTWRDVLGQLIARTLAARDRGEAAVLRREPTLVAELATALSLEPGQVGHALAALTLDRGNAAWHAAVPGVAAAPLVRVGPDHLVLSHYGLTTEPLLFLARELRRRAAQEYHNAAWLREDVFRQDLYALFRDRRFVTAPSRIQLRRGGGDIRTDIDAVVFDRKTGTLGVFELKSQDPFARSLAERTRQRDNFFHANRQVSGVLAWLNRPGAADEILGRFDSRSARTFRVQKVYPFVLGRYLAHFSDGPEPDRRAAWGTWPQLLRILGGQSVRASDASPIASLFANLTKGTSSVPPAAGGPRRDLSVGAVRLIVHPSLAAYRTSADAADAPGASQDAARPSS